MGRTSKSRSELIEQVQPDPAREQALELLVTSDHSIRRIGEIVGVSHCTVLRWLERENAEYRMESGERIERYRRRQRRACYELLKKWEPLATAERLEIQRYDRKGGAYIDEDAYDEAAKAAAIVLKTLERLAKLDGLDAAERKELTINDRSATPVELAERVRSVTPLLLGRIPDAAAAQGAE